MALSRRFSERTRQALEQLMSRRLEGVELAALMLDGIELQGRTNVVCLGIGTDGTSGDDAESEIPQQVGDTGGGMLTA